MRITAEYIELKRKLAEVRAHKRNIQAMKRAQRPSVEADQITLLAFLEAVERNTADEIALYELPHAEAALLEQIMDHQKWIEIWEGNPTKSVVRSLRKYIRQRNEWQTKLQMMSRRKVELQERINRFYREEGIEHKKANANTRRRLARKLQGLKSLNTIGESQDSSTQEQPAIDVRSGPEPKDSFSHTLDYQNIYFKGVHYRITPQAAAIIRALDEARQQGLNQVSTQHIKMVTKCGRIRDSFRVGDGSKLWMHLVIAVKGCKGFYRLNLHSPEKN